ncbi:thioredoxin domain-containing protein [Streptomyces sp. GC420]|uniref:DsbA family protein n=1 Tax=Streptomyces sp. GC420 TaxID=2697568 RepID=UPI001414EF97|nr:thioredoxin domain-containing protein [Streptomyces sp. GC420]NBM19303.1 thioredoxin domain-containing protein [Streptomyces sp. GC420]
MSDKNREGKRTARERLAEERERQRSRDKRKRTVIVAASIVAVLGIAAGIGIALGNAGDGDTGTDAAGPVVVPSGANGDDGPAIPVGEDTAKSTLVVWEDFRCPACKNFELQYRDTVNSLVAGGKLRVQYHLATIIDNGMGGSGSLRSANAAACAQDAGKFPAYHDVLFENQPPESEDAFARNSRLIDLAGKVEGLDTPAFRTCVEDGTHDSWVAKSQEAFEKAGLTGTPTVLLDGKNIFADTNDPMTPEELKAQVEKAATA